MHLYIKSLQNTAKMNQTLMKLNLGFLKKKILSFAQKFLWVLTFANRQNWNASQVLIFANLSNIRKILKNF